MLDALLHQCAPDVDQLTMRAIVEVESGGHPWVININRGYQLVRQPRSQAEAAVTARQLVRLGYNIDVGHGQINSSNWSWLRLNAETAFDRCTNLRAAQTVLVDCFKRAPSRNPQIALREALSCFNTGNFTAGFSNGYVGRVLRAAAAIRSTNLQPKESP
jgi:type IV secretion system protein VirB1